MKKKKVSECSNETTLENFWKKKKKKKKPNPEDHNQNQNQNLSKT